MCRWQMLNTIIKINSFKLECARLSVLVSWLRSLPQLATDKLATTSITQVVAIGTISTLSRMEILQQSSVNHPTRRNRVRSISTAVQKIARRTRHCLYHRWTTARRTLPQFSKRTMENTIQPWTCKSASQSALLKTAVGGLAKLSKMKTRWIQKKRGCMISTKSGLIQKEIATMRARSLEFRIAWDHKDKDLQRQTPNISPISRNRKRKKNTVTSMTMNGHHMPCRTSIIRQRTMTAIW